MKEGTGRNETRKWNLATEVIKIKNNVTGLWSLKSQKFFHFRHVLLTGPDRRQCSLKLWSRRCRGSLIFIAMIYFPVTYVPTDGSLKRNMVLRSF